jgi:hypothetical protein
MAALVASERRGAGAAVSFEVFMSTSIGQQLLTFAAAVPIVSTRVDQQLLT